MSGNGRDAWVIVLFALAIGSSGVLYTLTDSSPTSRWYAASLNFSVPSGTDHPFFVQVNHDQSNTYLSANGAFVGTLPNPSPTIWLRFTDFASFAVSVFGSGAVKVWMTDKNGNVAPNEALCGGTRLFCDPKVPSVITLAQQRVEGNYYTEMEDATPVVLHLMNVGAGQVNGTVTLGISTVVNSKPGFFIGIAFLGIAALYLVPEIDKYVRPAFSPLLHRPSKTG